MLNHSQHEQKSSHFQEKILSSFKQSLTEEQRFLQGILSGKIKTYSHEEIVADLHKTLKR